MKKVTLEGFIAKAQAKHGFKYDYSRVVYTNAHAKIEIGCPEHGWFWQKASHHLLYDCKQCGNNASGAKRRTSIEKFIEKAKAVHDERYDYSLVKMQKQHDLVEIICPTHGVFRQAANDHLKGHGCEKCGAERRGDARRGNTKVSTEDFAARARAVHGDWYIYDRTIYTGANNQLTITCPDHGDFLQFPHNHLHGNGCRECAKLKMSISFEQFVGRAKNIHADRYSYAKDSYDKLSEKVGIECPEHGLFWQMGVDHIFAEAGCPKCAYLCHKSQNAWLDLMGIDQREVWLDIGEKRIKADGYDPSTRTVYEFWGDFWHGNPKVFDQNEMNWVSRCTFGELYEKTLNKRKLITNNGYKLIEIWESDWRAINGKKSIKGNLHTKKS